MAALVLASILAVASAGGLYDLSAYSVSGQNNSLSVYNGKVVLVVNSAHL